MILEPGTFRTSEYRKAITDLAKGVALIRYVKESGLPVDDQAAIDLVRSLQYDHRPALQDRPYDTDKGDFDPPQNDPRYIFAIDKGTHGLRTFGRKPDAEKTVTTVGSDAHNRAHSRRLRDREARHHVQMAMKRGDPEAISRILGTVKQKTKPKRQWPKRSFPKRQERDRGAK